jgi:integrase
MILDKSKLTKTKQTEINYLKRVNGIKEYLLMDNEEIAPVDMVDWLVKKKKSIRKSTFRQYKSALIYFFEKHNKYKDYQDALAYLETIEQSGCIDDKNNLVSLERHKNTSASKIKKVDIEDLEKIRLFLTTSRSLWQKRAFLLFELSIHLGLRPIEWNQSIIEKVDGLTFIRIKNAKNTNGRANGDSRIIEVKDALLSDINNLIEDIALFKEKDSFEHYYDNARVAFNKMMHKIFPKRKQHYSLYSARHQFSANQKNIHTKREVADMMGHKSEETATLHYGKKRSGWSNYKKKESQVFTDKPKN